MKNITIKTVEGKECKGDWNYKFYNSKIEGTYKIYLNNECCIITKETKENLLTEIYQSKNLEKFTILANSLRETVFGSRILNEDEIIEIIETAKESIDNCFDETIHDKNNQDEIKKFRFAVKNKLNNDYFVRELGKEKIEELRNIIAEEYLNKEEV